MLDLFCKAGGCGMGYSRAGFDVTGVDIESQKRYPFAFIQGDALEYVAEHGQEYDVIHASPPCQAYSVATKATAGAAEKHPDLVAPVRELLIATGKPWVIENVPGAPLSQGSLVLCGLMFGLKVFRHRLFESSHLLFAPPHPSHRGHRIGMQGFCTVAGGGNSGVRDRTSGRLVRRRPEDGVAGWRRAMGIDWMTRDELSQAIPPAYTHYIGTQIIRLF